MKTRVEIDFTKRTVKCTDIPDGEPPVAGAARGSAAPEGLGVNRMGDAILCYAWGETDRPSAMLAKSATDVKRFILTEWIGDETEPYLQEIMEELAKHDWREESVLSYEFEIGGCQFTDVVAVPPNSAI